MPTRCSLVNRAHLKKHAFIAIIKQNSFGDTVLSRRSISHIIVINPPGLGKKRRRVFEKQFDSWQKHPPPISYIGVNKNHLDLSTGSKYQRLIDDDRNRWVKLKLRLGLEKHSHNFKKEYDPLLRENSKVTEILPLGHIACTLSHIKAWKLCCKIPDDTLCMVVEDDALINPAIEFDSIQWPEAADFLHLWPGAIGFYEKYSDEYVKIVRKWQPDRCNWTTLGYIITPNYARRLLSQLIPYTINRTVDMELLYTASGTLFATKKPWVRQINTPRLTTQSMQFISLAHTVVGPFKCLFPKSLRARHPAWLKEQETQFDEPRLE